MGFDLYIKNTKQQCSTAGLTVWMKMSKYGLEWGRRSDVRVGPCPNTLAAPIQRPDTSCGIPRRRAGKCFRVAHGHVAQILGDIRSQQVPQQQQLQLLWLACSEPALGSPMPELVWVRHTSQFCISSRFVIARNGMWKKKRWGGGWACVHLMFGIWFFFGGSVCVCGFMWKTYLDCLRKKKKKKEKHGLNFCANKR